MPVYSSLRVLSPQATASEGSGERGDDGLRMTIRWCGFLFGRSYWVFRLLVLLSIVITRRCLQSVSHTRPSESPPPSLPPSLPSPHTKLTYTSYSVSQLSTKGRGLAPSDFLYLIPPISLYPELQRIVILLLVLPSPSSPPHPILG